MQDLAVVTAAVLMISTLYAVQNLIRYIKAKDANGALGIVLACLGGIGVVFVAANANATDGLVLIKNGPPLGLLNGASLCMLGVFLGSGGTVVADYLQARDNSQTAAKPKLIEPRHPTTK
jgi:drug/metabolite transporter (DMT)-like permease